MGAEEEEELALCGCEFRHPGAEQVCAEDRVGTEIDAQGWLFTGLSSFSSSCPR